MCDATTKRKFIAVSRMWMEGADRECGTHFIFDGTSTDAGVVQRYGYVGIRRTRDTRTNMQVRPFPVHRLRPHALFPAKRPVPVLDIVWRPTLEDKEHLRRIDPKTLRLIGMPHRRLTRGWTWLNPRRCIIFCENGLSRSSEPLALSRFVDKIVFYLDPKYREDGKRGTPPPAISNYRRWGPRRVVFIFPPMRYETIKFEDLHYLARAIALYPAKEHGPLTVRGLGSYTIVNFPGVHQRMTVSMDKTWDLPPEDIKARFMKKIDEHRRDVFRCWETEWVVPRLRMPFDLLHSPISQQQVLHFQSIDEYKQGLKGGQWEEETISNW